MLISISSCNNLKSNNSSSLLSSSSFEEQTNQVLITNYDEKKEIIINCATFNSDYFVENDLLCIDYISNIHRIYTTMTFNEEKKLDIPDLRVRKVYETFYVRHEEKLSQSIEYSENGYFACSGSDTLTNYTYFDGIIYNYAYCNQKVELLKQKAKISSYSTYDEETQTYTKIEYEIGYEVTSFAYGNVIHTQYSYEKDGNYYVIGSKLLNKTIYPNSKSVQYINQNSNLLFPLGCLNSNVVNIEQYEDKFFFMDEFKSIDIGNYIVNFSTFIIGENVDNFPEVKNPRKYSNKQELYASEITLHSMNEDAHICGVNLKMNLNEAKETLLKQGFTLQELKVKDSPQGESNVFYFNMENVVIVLQEVDDLNCLNGVKVYIDNFESYRGFIL